MTRMHPLIGGHNTEDHDFGYDCTMPHTVEIDGLHVDDSRAQEGGGVCLIGYMNPNRTNEEAEAAAAYPYRPTETVIVRNLTTASGKGWVLTPNKFMFRNLKLIEE